MNQSESAYLDLPGVAVVKWDPGLRSVFVELQGWANDLEVEAILDTGLRALTEHHGSRWLADGRNMKVVRQADQEWIIENWMPRALAAGLRRNAVVTAKSGLAMRNLEDMLAKVPSDRLEVGYFPTVDLAAAWLIRPPSARPVVGVSKSQP
ncbi:MAG TPA: hypothetical protein VMW11_00490 [Candidatus Dormibacteraeota bacterium]|nr:hypothetical protein [Candidatus Dormibacteraeota bacterium]